MATIEQIEKSRTWRKEYYTKNREELLAKRKAYYYRDREKHIQQVKEWQRSNPDKMESYAEKSRIRAARYRAENPKRVAQKSREWKLRNPDKVKAASRRSRLRRLDKVRAYQRGWAERNKDKIREANSARYKKLKSTYRDYLLKKTFGITLERYNEMLLAQNNSCAICSGGPDASGKTFAVDHCHKTGKIRSLLCRGCNVGIGNLRDDPDLLEKAARYIKEHRTDL